MYVFKNHNEVDANLKDTRWVDGLRGVASVFVVSSHIILCIARGLMNPCCGPDERTPTLFQLPFLRLISAGHSWVATFFLLSGFVNSLKPLKAMRRGRPDLALSNLATSSFRRSFRLVLPASAATVIGWLFCNLGLYEIGSHSDAHWLQAYNPKPSASWGQAIVDLFLGLRNTWSFNSENPYDQPQWLLKWLLLGSMMVFMSLMITVHMSPLWRTVTVLSITGCSFQWTYHSFDPSLGQSILPGILFAELSISSNINRLSSFSWLLTPILLFMGGFMMSFPSNSPSAIPWSHFMLEIGRNYLPETHDPPRVWGAFGAITALLGIMISQSLRRALSTRVCLRLGRISYPIYLLHGIFLRTVFAWIMFAGVEPVQVNVTDSSGAAVIVERYPLPGGARTTLALVVSMALLWITCELWENHMEPLFGRITKMAETFTAAEPVSPGKLEYSAEYP